MNYLAGKRVYLSGPIEFGAGPNWRTDKVKILSERYKLEVFDPFADPKQQWVPDLKVARENKDFETMRTIAKNFVRKDLALVDRSDFLIANLPFKVPTTGSHHEIINSNNAKKPTLLLSEGKENIPLWYYGFIPPESMFGSWDELWQYLDDVDAGKHMNNSRWAFTYGLI